MGEENVYACFALYMEREAIPPHIATSISACIAGSIAKAYGNAAYGNAAYGNTAYGNTGCIESTTH
jgi:hypothetical protein